MLSAKSPSTLAGRLNSMLKDWKDLEPNAGTLKVQTQIDKGRLVISNENLRAVRHKPDSLVSVK